MAAVAGYGAVSPAGSLHGGDARPAVEHDILKSQVTMPATVSWLTGDNTAPVDITEALAPYREVVLDSCRRVRTDLGLERYCRLATKLTGMKYSAVQMMDRELSYCLDTVNLPIPDGAPRIAPASTVACKITFDSKASYTRIADLRTDSRTGQLPFIEHLTMLRAYLGVPLTTRDGRNIGTICVMDDAPDAPEESAQTAERVEALKDLAELVRNELDLRIDGMVAAKAKEVFLSNVNHDIKSPLHGLMASTELLASEDDGSYARFTPFQKQCVSNIQHCSNNLMDVINNVLSFQTMTQTSPLDRNVAVSDAGTGSRPATSDTVDPAPSTFSTTTNGELPRPSLTHASLSRQPTDLCQLVEDVLDSCWIGKRQCPKKRSSVRAIVNIAPEIISTTPYLIDKGEFTRCLMNIFSNGCKYTDVGYVQVSVFADAIQRYQGLQSICILVQDTGRGIPAAFIESGALFQPFRQGDSSSEGVGLGMSIVKRLLEANDGELTVNSLEGLGTTVSMRIELEPAPGAKTTIASFLGKRYYLTGRTPAKTDQKICEAIMMALDRWYGLVRTTSLTEADVAILQSVAELDDYRTRCPDTPCILVSDGANDWKSLDNYSNVHIAQIPVGAKKLGKLLEVIFPDRERQPSASVAMSAAMTTLSTEDEPVNGRHHDAGQGAAEATDLTPPEAQAPTQAPTPPLDNLSRETITPFKAPTKRSAQGAFSPATALQHDIGGGLRRKNLHSGVSVTAPTGEAVRLEPPNGDVLQDGITPSAAAPHARKVLCCEDDEVNLRILATIVDKLGYTYETARDGVDAVRRFGEALSDGRPFDTVLCDIGLPGTDGLEAAHRMRQLELDAGVPTERQARIVALTGGHGADDVARCKEAGMDEYLQKPVPVKVLRKLLTQGDEH